MPPALISRLPIVISAALAFASGVASADAKHAASRSAEPASGLVVGEFHLAKVVDGDTIRVDGLDGSLRLLGIDTEETFKHAKEKRAFAAGWDAYLKKMRGGSPRPVKLATPMGDAAKVWAASWFAGVDIVRVERDHPAEIRDRYNRYLAYVFVKKHDTWLNYNVECVRAGMAPYFPKYGTSRRFHAEFLAAEAEAKAAARGIWAPDALADPDYPEREAWWAARGTFVDKFRAAADRDPSFIDLTHDGAIAEIEARIGQQVTLLGAVDRVSKGATSHAPIKVLLASSVRSGFPLIVFDRDVFAATGLSTWQGELVTVTGIPSIYENKQSHTKQLQIVIDRASQIELAPVPAATPAPGASR